MSGKQQNPSGTNRRQYERVKVTRKVRMEATLRGRFIDIMRLELNGATIDLSDGGFAANVDQSISPGVRCRVEFSDAAGESRSLWGRVRRLTGGKNGYLVALEFDEPLVAAELLGGQGNGNGAGKAKGKAGKTTTAAKKAKAEAKEASAAEASDDEAPTGLTPQPASVLEQHGAGEDTEN